MNSAETRTLIRALDAALLRGQRAAVASVVRVHGSAYRREGTRMLILDDASQVCMLSGGCLEAEVVESALEVIASGTARVVHYDLSEDATWGLGLGCGGSVDVRIERVEDDAVTRGWLDALRSGEAAALCVPLTAEGHDGGRVLLRGDTVTGALSDPALQAFALEAARARLHTRDPRAATLSAPDGQELFIDLSVPAPNLLIYGAGHDAQPLSAQAVALGYRTVVVDPRRAYLTPERFPGAVLLPLAPDELQAELRLDSRTQAIIMNHHLDRDRVCLWHALNSEAAFIGVLGPRSRYTDLLDALAQEGHLPTAAQTARVHSPVGLALGAEAPEEVALSILGELMAWRRGASGIPLNGHEGPIHQTYVARRT
ncbi:XdhC family protein [Deinococcus sp. KNUC1210]|uniref:XdhC family protein n=1 Tax=Deinococcus sp. KNUC1210 TaxID=2917691 RepID=UPI001EF038C8|nr:XdhC/CoxI family protein [Deinococcus sp. KNUC1210]ULH16818.1 XdhC family protein [Deinococcus sp. KNUC1210]